MVRVSNPSTGEAETGECLGVAVEIQANKRHSLERKGRWLPKKGQLKLSSELYTHTCEPTHTHLPPTYVHTNSHTCEPTHTYMHMQMLIYHAYL